MVTVAPSSPAPYRLLETVRGFALDQLDRSGQRAATEDRFVGHVVDAVLTIMERGRPGWSAEVLHELLSKYDAIAAALALCLERDAEPTRSLLLTSVLWGVVHNGHVDDVAQLARQTLQRWPDAQQPFWSDAMASLATATLMLGDIDTAVAHAESALPHARTSPFAPVTLRRVLGLAAQAAGDHERAATTFAATAEAARASEAGAMAMEADVLRAQALSLSGHRAEALDILRASRREAAAGGWDVNSAFAAIVEGLVLLPTDGTAAWACLVDALETSRTAPYPFGIAASLQSMAYAHLREGRDEEAAATIVDLVEEMSTSPSDWSRADPLGPLAALMHRRGTSGWEDVAATVEWRARTSPLPAAGLHLVDLPAERGRVLAPRQATDVMLSVLGSPSSATAPASASRSSPASLTLDGEMWAMTYAGTTAHLKPSKGMTDLAQLLTRPGTDVSCLDLAGAAVEDSTTGEVIDTAARRAYEDRIRELQADADEAEAHGDSGRAERAHAELDALVDHLTASLGLAGRSRRHVDTTERARSAVTQRIRATIKRIDSAHPQLGAHLRSSIRTGTYASYRPETPVRWTVRGSRRDTGSHASSLTAGSAKRRAGHPKETTHVTCDHPRTGDEQPGQHPPAAHRRPLHHRRWARDEHHLPAGHRPARLRRLRPARERRGTGRPSGATTRRSSTSRPRRRRASSSTRRPGGPASTGAPDSATTPSGWPRSTGERSRSSPSWLRAVPRSMP